MNHAPSNTAAILKAASDDTLPDPSPIDEILSMLGDDAVLLPIPSGTKAPVIKNWQNYQKPDYDDPEVRKTYAGKNIGVLLGRKSGGLCAIDIDHDDAVEPFLSDNPELKNSLRTKGQRGCNIWVDMLHDDYPPLTKIKTVTGGDWGEWRADGGQSVIYGNHPSGCGYQRVVDEEPVQIGFEQIIWPADAVAPSMEESLLEEYDRLVAQIGPPYSLDRRRIQVNQSFFAEKFAIEHKVLWHPDERRFYHYNHKTGLWKYITNEALKYQINRDYVKAAHAFGDEDKLIGQNTNSLLQNVLELLKGIVEQPEAFKNDQRTIHLPNGMFCLKCQPPTLFSYHWDYYARSGCGITLEPEADCPQFKNDLLGAALDADDVLLVQKWMGSVLLGCNPSQSILILMGTAGGGKSTLISVLERIIGHENMVQLRSEQLEGRFEVNRFVGKKLLCGQDVSSGFLNNKSAPILKALVGGDLMTPEKKNSNNVESIRGDFNVVMTTNTQIQIRLDGDHGAWQRRLIVVDYKRSTPANVIPNFAEKLIQSEGAGILNFMIEGAVLYLRDVDNYGYYALTDLQKHRVFNLVHNSDSLKKFLLECIETDADCEHTNREIRSAYEDYCIEHGFDAMGKNEYYKKLSPMMHELYSVKPRHDIDGGLSGGDQRGFKGIRIRNGGR